ncbi:hypothetical protein VTK73DRAFT_8275 [Phialemonium thermophilum]|uniref:Uncharacterized protein n=1 Tax=Phialemonium thermophilum TaxID=223376 RepID=A0ABR3W9B1_9PEZI
MVPSYGLFNQSCAELLHAVTNSRLLYLAGPCDPPIVPGQACIFPLCRQTSPVPIGNGGKSTDNVDLPRFTLYGVALLLSSVPHSGQRRLQLDKRKEPWLARTDKKVQVTKYKLGDLDPSQMGGKMGGLQVGHDNCQCLRTSSEIHTRGFQPRP